MKKDAVPTIFNMVNSLWIVFLNTDSSAISKCQVQAAVQIVPIMVKLLLRVLLNKSGGSDI
jgi:hypothetical protein